MQTQITMDRSTVMQIFKKGSDEIKKLLMINCPSNTFTGKMIERLKTYEDFYNEADLETQQEAKIYATDPPYFVAEKKLALIIKVINFDEETGKQFIPSLEDTSQKKWFPVFYSPSGSGFDFSFSHYYCAYSFTFAGLRLCTATKEKCDFVATQFLNLYKQYITL